MQDFHAMSDVVNLLDSDIDLDLLTNYILGVRVFMDFSDKPEPDLAHAHIDVMSSRHTIKHF